jgi:hypothetical protein
MKYPAPRTLLNFFASHGPSAVQVEALAMLGRPAHSLDAKEKTMKGTQQDERYQGS